MKYRFSARAVARQCGPDRLIEAALISAGSAVAPIGSSTPPVVVDTNPRTPANYNHLGPPIEGNVHSRQATEADEHE
jgi:hypothetical protein